MLPEPRREASLPSLHFERKMCYTWQRVAMVTRRSLLTERGEGSFPGVPGGLARSRLCPEGAGLGWRLLS